MTHSDALWQIVSALAVILTVVASRLSSRREHQRGLTETSEKIDVVQETMNGTTADLHKRIDQLSGELTAAGIAVPDSPEST